MTISSRRAPRDRRRSRAHGRLLDETSRLLDETSRLLDETSRLLDETSRFLDEISRLLDERSRLLDEISRLLDEISRLLDETSRLLDEISLRLVVGPGSRATCACCSAREALATRRISASREIPRPQAVLSLRFR